MGGHGGLNILPQKSWNVYSRKNRERVAQDEARAAQEEQDAAFAAASDKAGLNLMVMRARAGGMHEHVAPVKVMFTTSIGSDHHARPFTIEHATSHIF